jgi:hypothetical protein
MAGRAGTLRHLGHVRKGIRKVTLPEPHPNLENLCRNLDRLMTTEARMSDYSRGAIIHLYEAARQAQGGGPLSLLAARHVLAAAQPGRIAIVATGAGGHKFMPHGETDGPLGAVVLARAIHEATGATPVLLTDHHSRESLEAAALAAGLGIRPLEVAREVGFTTHVVTLGPGEPDEAGAEALLDRLDPCLLCSVERLGPAPDGIAYNASGNPAATVRALTERIFDIAASRAIPSLGIGDNGNEIGFGRIYQAVVAHKPFGDRLATRVATDVLVPANTSNWGAYAVVAAIAAVLRRPEIAHDGATESRILRANAAAGSADGSTGRHILAVDGVPEEVNQGVVEFMRCIVRNGLAIHKRAF